MNSRYCLRLNLNIMFLADPADILADCADPVAYICEICVYSICVICGK